MVRFATYDGPQDGEWFVVGLRRDDAAGGSRDSIAAVAAEDVSHIAVVNPELERLLPDWAHRLLEELPADTACASVLVALRECPWPEARSDGRIYSFIATADVFRRVLQLAPDARPWHLCFQLLHAALNGTLPLDKLIIRQLPYPELPPPPPELPPTSVIMPHRGNPQHLRTALSFVDRLDGARLQSLIGLDMDDPAEYRTL